MPDRTDLGSGKRAPKGELLRWFIGPDDEPWPDWTGRARVADRTVHTGPDAASVRAAADTRAFSRGMKRRVAVPDADVLVARAFDAGIAAWANRLGLANRAGVVAVGQIGGKEAMRSSDWLLLLAEDAGDATASKFAENALRKGCGIVRSAGSWFGAALGREFVSVAVVARSPFSETLADWARALATYPMSTLRVESDPEPR